MTENDARQKWCPMVRFHTSRNGDVSNNRVHGMDNDGYDTCCIASDCMMWRWNPDNKRSADNSPPEGYCGLAS